MYREKNDTRRYIIKKRNNRYSEDENMYENMSKTHLFSAATFLEEYTRKKKKKKHIRRIYLLFLWKEKFSLVHEISQETLVTTSH